MTTAAATRTETHMNVEWATSRNGKLRVACGTPQLQSDARRDSTTEWRVWALYVGTHDLAPFTKKFTGPNAEQQARRHANWVWGL